LAPIGIGEGQRARRDRLRNGGAEPDQPGRRQIVEAAFRTFYSEGDVTFNAVADTGIGF
jgi:hypothetical protein